MEEETRKAGLVLCAMRIIERIKSINKSINKSVNFTFPGLFKKNRFWTFINVHFPKRRHRLEKNPQKTRCDHNALISVFS